MLRAMRLVTRAAALSALCAGAALTGGCAPVPEGEVDPSAEGLEESTDEARAPSEYFYTVRRDTRRCAAPACGGYWLARAGYTSTRCGDGRAAASCYVPTLATPGLTGADRDRVLGAAQGTRVALVVSGTLERASAVVSRAWVAPSGAGELTGTLRWAYRPECAPNERCASLVTRPLSRETTTVLAQADLGAAPGTDAELDRAREALTRPEGIVATGRIATLPGGARSLEVSQYLLPVVATATPEPAARLCGRALEQTLATASDGLLVTSESDYPFTVESRAGAGAQPLTVARFRTVFSVPTSQPVQVRTIAEQFGWASTDRPDMSDEERATAARFRALFQTVLFHMPDAQVFRVGTVQVHTYVVGRTSCGDVAGLKTLLIET